MPLQNTSATVKEVFGPPLGQTAHLCNCSKDFFFTFPSNFLKKKKKTLQTWKEGRGTVRNFSFFNLLFFPPCTELKLQEDITLKSMVFFLAAKWHHFTSSFKVLSICCKLTTDLLSNYHLKLYLRKQIKSVLSNSWMLMRGVVWS